MEKEWDLLVVSTRVEDRSALLHILESLPVNVFIASTVEQAVEVLSCHTIRLVFCEEILAYSSFPNLFATIRDVHAEVRLMIDGHQYVLIDPLCRRMEGVFGEDVISRDGCDPSSLPPTNVELALIGTVRHQKVH
jgi:hypothetical protein